MGTKPHTAWRQYTPFVPFKNQCGSFVTVRFSTVFLPKFSQKMVLKQVVLGNYCQHNNI